MQGASLTQIERADASQQGAGALGVIGHRGGVAQAGIFIERRSERSGVFGACVGKASGVVEGAFPRLAREAETGQPAFQRLAGTQHRIGGAGAVQGPGEEQQ